MVTSRHRELLTFFSHRFLRQRRTNSRNHLRMYLLPRRNNAKVLAERSSKSKVQRAPIIIRDDTAGLFDKQRSRCMVLPPHP